MAISLFGSALLLVLHTALSSEGGGDGRKDGDEDVKDFTPGGIVVECSHSVLDVWLKVRFVSQMHHDL